MTSAAVGPYTTAFILDVFLLAKVEHCLLQESVEGHLKNSGSSIHKDFSTSPSNRSPLVAFADLKVAGGDLLEGAGSSIEINTSRSGSFEGSWSTS